MSIEEITQASQYLTFTLNEETFAVDVGTVREILDYTTITAVPRTPPYMRGVINLRGSVVPVVDLRQKFGMEGTEKTVTTCIIVMDLVLEGENTTLGTVVDSVEEVLDLEPAQIEPAPRLGTRLNTDFLKGMGKHGESFIMILDINKIFSADELDLVVSEDVEAA